MGIGRFWIVLALCVLLIPASAVLIPASAVRADEDGGEAKVDPEPESVTAEQRDAALKKMFAFLDDRLWKLGENGSSRKHYAAAMAGWAYLICGEKVKGEKKLPSRKKQITRIHDFLTQYAETVARGYERDDERIDKEAKKKKKKKKKDKPKGPPGFGMMGMRNAQYVWNLGVAAHFFAESAARGKSKSASKKSMRVITKVLAAAQQENGGWGHDDAQREGMGLPPIKIPKPGGDPLEYPGTLLGASNCALSGLGAAHAQLGGKKPTETMTRGRAYFVKFQNGDGTWPYDPTQKHEMRGRRGGGMGGAIAIARTSGSVLSLHLVGMDGGDEVIQRALAALDKSPQHLGDGHGSAGMALGFSAVLAAARGGEAWATFRRIYFPKILEKQHENGGCDCVCNDSPGVTNDTRELPGMKMPGWVDGGRVYVTAIHALILALDRAPSEGVPPLQEPKEKVVTR